MRFNWIDSYPVNLNEFCHCLVLDKIVSFDFINEIFIATTLPAGHYIRCRIGVRLPRFRLETYLAGIHGSIAFISNIEVSMFYDIWILGELGVEESFSVEVMESHIFYLIINYSNNVILEYSV